MGLNTKDTSNHLFFGLIIFFIVCIAWVFFRANTLNDSFYIIKGIFTDFNFGDVFNKETYLIGLKTNEFKVIILSILLLFAGELLHLKYNLIEIVK